MAREIIQSNGDIERAYSTAAERLLKHLGSVTAPNVVLGLCGGRSVVGLLKGLKAIAVGEAAAVLARVQFFMVDERLVPITDEQSNYGGLKKLLFDDLVASRVISQNQLHPFVPDPAKPDHGTSEYFEELSQFGGAFSAIVLGIGEDGHVAGLFPCHPVLQRNEPGFISFYDSPKPPPQRMTATIPLLQSAGFSVVLALGEAKRDAWASFNNPSSTVESCPATLTRSMASTCIVTDLE